MKYSYLYYLTILISSTVLGQIEDKQQIEMVTKLVALIKNDQIDSLSLKVDYPLRREYPLPDIKNEIEFKNEYSNIIDSTFKAEITSSDIKTNWSDMGWRGIMLNHGSIWIGYSGNVTAINNETKAEEDKRLRLIDIEKCKLHQNVRKFKRPICIFNTSKFRIRIDELNDNSYRYTSWNVNDSISSVPSLIINSGEWIPDGTGGNNYYRFKNGIYTYEIYIIVIGMDESPDAELTVFKDNKEILKQEMTFIRN